ncbi:MAG TPA: UpxY family transcription antiterminator [Puia sp.]|jgi:transcription antitermination factor NusG|nr:UpxY family transcription antiterminator [Puia sp.]
MSKGTKQWLAVYTKPRWEKKVFGLLSDKGIEAYCPMNKVKKRWSDRLKWVEEPLFKSYVFVRVTAEEQSGVRLTNGVLNFIYWLGKPAVVRPEEIELIRRFLDEFTDIQVEPLELKPDDTVMITGGAMMEKEGKVIKQYGNRVAIEIVSLGRRLVVQVNKQKVVRQPPPKAGRTTKTHH